MNFEIAPRTAALALVGASFIALLGAFIAQYGYDLEPCILCLWQRVPYGIAIFAGLSAMQINPKLILWFLACLFLAGAGIAFFHVGVEKLWWEGTNACTHAFDANNLEALREQILKPKPRCDTVAWQMFGISMAGYNVAYSLILAFIAMFFARND